MAGDPASRIVDRINPLRRSPSSSCHPLAIA
jgi:hypothetical protein